MKVSSVFIIGKDVAVANLIRYSLVTRQAGQVQVFPNVEECLHFMDKRQAPDFIVADLDHPDLNASTFLEHVKTAFPRVRVVFLSPVSDDLLLSKLLEEGATDCICKSAQREEWIRELVKNLEYLTRISSRADQV
jgi:DNA-binding NarL/FixJ family response regulator